MSNTINRSDKFARMSNAPASSLIGYRPKEKRFLNVPAHIDLSRTVRSKEAVYIQVSIRCFTDSGEREYEMLYAGPTKFTSEISKAKSFLTLESAVRELEALYNLKTREFQIIQASARNKGALTVGRIH